MSTLRQLIWENYKKEDLGMSDICCYTLLSRDTDLLRWSVSNAKERAGIDHDWLLIHWVNVDQTEEENQTVYDTAMELGMRYHRFDAAPPEEFPDRTTHFLHNLYKGFNLGYEVADTPWVARMGSDQFFGKGWLAQLMKAVEVKGERAVYHCWTVESEVAKKSRHEIRSFGSTPETFDVKQWDQYADHLIHRYSSRLTLTPAETRLYYNHPTRGIQLRCDGCTWLQHKSLWEEFGPMDDKINKEGVTGDVGYMDRIYDSGIVGYLVPSAPTWHAVRGESREIQV